MNHLSHSSDVIDRAHEAMSEDREVRAFVESIQKTFPLATENEVYAALEKASQHMAGTESRATLRDAVCELLRTT